MNTQKPKKSEKKDAKPQANNGHEPTVPIQQFGTYSKATKKVVREAVTDLNPDTSSLDSRG